MIRTLAVFVLLTCPSHAATLAEHLAASRSVLLSWVAGEFSNERQVREGTNALADAPTIDAAAPDLLFPVFKRIDVPAIGNHVVYLQWPMGAPDGKLQRQRIWVFEENPPRNAVTMKFFTLKEPDKWLNAHLDPAKVRNMTVADVIPYPPPCDLPFRRHGDVFIGEIPKGECKIVSQQSKTTMFINARIVVGKDSVWYDEPGVREDGSVAFKVPRLGAYEFEGRK